MQFVKIVQKFSSDSTMTLIRWGVRNCTNGKRHKSIFSLASLVMRSVGPLGSRMTLESVIDSRGRLRPPKSRKMTKVNKWLRSQKMTSQSDRQIHNMLGSIILNEVTSVINNLEYVTWRREIKNKCWTLLFLFSGEVRAIQDNRSAYTMVVYYCVPTHISRNVSCVR